MTEFEEIEKVFKQFMTSINLAKIEAIQLMRDIPEGAERDELNLMLAQAMSMNKPKDLMKVAELAKKKAQEIKRRNGNKGNGNK